MWEVDFAVTSQRMLIHRLLSDDRKREDLAGAFQVSIHDSFSRRTRKSSAQQALKLQRQDFPHQRHAAIEIFVSNYSYQPILPPQRKCR